MGARHLIVIVSTWTSSAGPVQQSEARSALRSAGCPMVRPAHRCQNQCSEGTLAATCLCPNCQIYAQIVRTTLLRIVIPSAVNDLLSLSN
jgi:hypothetical protein